MKSSLKLKEERAPKKEQLEKKEIEVRALVEIAQKEDRDFSSDEQNKFNALKNEIQTLRSEIQEFDNKINDAEFNESINIQTETRKKVKEERNSEEKEKHKLVSEFRFTKAIGAYLNGKTPDGLEGEMHEEAVKEARQHNQTIKGLGIPRMIASPEKRDLTVGSATAGGNTVQTDLGELIDVLRPKLLTQDMGINVLTGLTGNLDLPKQTAYSSATWEGETDTAAETEPTFGKISLSPKRLAAFTEFSLQLQYQSSLAVENLVRQDLQTAIALAVDLAVINGTGSGQPTGILTLLLLANTIAGGTNGAAPDHDDIIDLEGAIDIQNALMGSLGYLTTPGVKKTLKKTKTDAGSGLFVWGQGEQTLNGYKTGVSTQVPSNLTKGLGTDLNAIIFGNWNDYILGQWGGLDIVFDPYTKATEGMRKITVNSFWDGDARNDESFAAMIDAIV